jgi:acyl-coenzyme A synthetase/AMP-(fatty) acid ligase
MPAYKCPKEIHFVEAFPKDMTGRVQRNKIKTEYLKKEQV